MELVPVSVCAAVMLPTAVGCKAVSDVTEVVGVPVTNPFAV